jgi:hypothetical protein
VDFAALGSFLSGVGAVLSAGVAIRLVRKRLEAECEKRMQAFRDGLDAGRRDR